ncbi:hypothetical protein ANCDUO_05052 [Ancylostoma duodenale]|uniref:SCP domain-containing protein n=1 Tax=Ancylostoma duodenale TaxID=51022 RepID=A0A0C2GZH9_9BILA|nr:hypothetical protein ANCDUO_05052 [Ancylostoma duodenale]
MEKKRIRTVPPLNMYRMRYDMELEMEAQTYANNCSKDGSPLSTRPYSGENTEVLPPTTTPYLEAIQRMAWGFTYKVGCGLQRCSHGTIVVCRYKPRGNIYTQYIYRPGTMCASCNAPCSEGLCPTPVN